MNDLLQLKGTFEQKKNLAGGGSPQLPVGVKVDARKLKDLERNLASIRKYWKKNPLLEKPLVSAYYKSVVAKSNRLGSLLAKRGENPSASIVGAKFAKGNPRHIITHCVSMGAIDESIVRLQKCRRLLTEKFEGVIDHDTLEAINSNKRPYPGEDIPKTVFAQVIKDAHYVNSFGVEDDVENLQGSAIVTVYETGIDARTLMQKLGIDLLPGRSIGENTFLLTEEQTLRLKQEAPFLIAMAVVDISLWSAEDFEDLPTSTQITIPEPKNEPTIGVIDTMFDEQVYFSDWVDFKNVLKSDFELTQEDYEHGTQVTSLIVDGAAINPDLNDECGRFRVRHFGVAKEGSFSSFSILRSIQEIVSENRDIKVWNLSLGSDMEVHPSFISPEAAILDQIQYDNDVVFVISGTNKTFRDAGDKRIGAPADSINGLVVNSVDFDKNPASYSRSGPVLSFFNKPDISYYGGTKTRGIRVCSPTGERLVCGTSYAAPWISRKMAYLIHIMGFSREVAKALVIDSAAGWIQKNNEASFVGFGVVPVSINDVLKSQNDEIRFTLSGVSEEYDTYTYNIPVPAINEKHPFIARATLCYFPKCNRNQGVDYTNTEMDIHFGRIKGKGIKSIDNNQQGDEKILRLYEEDARKQFRKWDNIKHIGEVLKSKMIPKKSYGDLWGVSIKTKERLGGHDGRGLVFGVVVTLKEIYGVNRIEEFIQQCAARGWLVNRINVESRIDVFAKAEEIVEFVD